LERGAGDTGHYGQAIAEFDVDALQIMFTRALDVDMHRRSGRLDRLFASLERLNAFSVNQGACGFFG
jgi:hypothetical protein